MTVINKTYLPFEREQLLTHFAEVGGKPNDRHRYLAYYEKSVTAAEAYIEATELYERALKSFTRNNAEWFREDPAHAARKKDLLAEKKDAMLSLQTLGIQMEKDERFWVAAALMSLYHSSNRVTAFAAVLGRAIGTSAPPPFKSWEEALGKDDELHLYFEVNLPSPKSYQAGFRGDLLKRTLVPFLYRNASATPTTTLEGTTKVDAMLISSGTHFAVAFEAKVFSDISTHIRYDALRNQLARNIDVLLDVNSNVQPPLRERSPDLTCLVLLTPELVRNNPETRLYGWLINSYRANTDVLAKHLPHRSPAQLLAASKRLGWMTWEDCNRVLPNSCPWLSADRYEAAVASEGEADRLESNVG